MSTKIIRISIYLFMALVLINCSSPNENESIQEYSDSYTPIQPGVNKQYLSFEDNRYQNNRANDFVKRDDGLNILSYSTSISSNDFEHESVHYKFVRDGYLISCSLTKSGESNNPFNEFKIAKTFPKNGDHWDETYPDSSYFQYMVEELNQMYTPAKIFENVIKIKSYSNYHQDSTYIYYAKGYGHIGTIIGSDTLLINYYNDGINKFGEFAQP